MRRFLRRELVVYGWPIPVAVLGFALASTNPVPYLITSEGWVQRALYLAMGLAALAVSIVPRRILVRDAFAAASVGACAFRATTLVVNPGTYSPNEVLAYATVWVVIGVLIVSMTIVTWPAIALRTERRR